MQAAIAKGAEIARGAAADGADVIALGEMGIGNTSSAACLMAVLCGLPLAACVGRGTGVSDEGLRRKHEILAGALARYDGGDAPLAVLTHFGGFEIAMMTGAMLGAAASRQAVLVDGFIASAAALVAAKLNPAVLDFCIFSHVSAEAGHTALLAHLDVQPLLALGLRLGEGTGAALALPLLQSATWILNEMASFAAAGVSRGSER